MMVYAEVTAHCIHCNFSAPDIHTTLTQYIYNCTPSTSFSALPPATCFPSTSFIPSSTHTHTLSIVAVVAIVVLLLSQTITTHISSTTHIAV